MVKTVQSTLVMALNGRLLTVPNLSKQFGSTTCFSTKSPAKWEQNPSVAVLSTITINGERRDIINCGKNNWKMPVMNTKWLRSLKKLKLEFSVLTTSPTNPYQ